MTLEFEPKYNMYIKVKENNEEWNRCIDSNGVILGRCVYGCGGNSECKDDCVAEFEERQLNCPCEVSFYSQSPSNIEDP